MASFRRPKAVIRVFLCLAVVVALGGCAGDAPLDGNRTGTVIGTWARDSEAPGTRSLSFREDGTYRYQYATLDHTAAYSLTGDTLVIQDNRIITPDTMTVSFPAEGRMRWTIPYPDGASTMDWVRTSASPN
jgi:hypothetical protein